MPSKCEALWTSSNFQLVLQKEGAWSGLRPRSQCCHHQGECLFINPWIIQASLCLGNLWFWRYWIRRLSGYNTPARGGLVFFPWGMLTDWRGLHLAVCIFFHIFHHRFKWNHVGSEREEGRQHRAAEETRPGSGDTWGVPWGCLWNVFFTEVPQPRTYKTITYSLQIGVESP